MNFGGSSDWYPTKLAQTTRAGRYTLLNVNEKSSSSKVNERMSRDAAATTDLTQLVVGSTNRVYPSDDAILDVLQARFRSDLSWTWIRDSTLVSINPFKPLENVNDASKRAYEQAYRDAAQDQGAPSLEPHVYELAARVYLMMRRRQESQSVIFRCAWYTLVAAREFG